MRWVVCFVLAGILPASSAWAQEEQTTDAAIEVAPEEPEEIVVRADGDSVRIDRRVYSVRNDPVAQSTDMFDVLGRIPSVSVDPSGAVTLLGAGNPTIQINGDPVAPGADLEQVLRGLRGADVERIEVITNPSAQYSSASSGGIINIITRQRFDTGFSGSASVSADTFGGARAGLSPSWSRGAWSLSGRFSYYRFANESDYVVRREDVGTGAVTRDVGAIDYNHEGYGGGVQASYQANQKNKLSFSLDSYTGNGDRSRGTDRTIDAAPVYFQSLNYDRNSAYDALSMRWERDGDEPSEKLRLNARATHWVRDGDTTVSLFPGNDPAPAPFLSGEGDDYQGRELTLDYETPRGERRFLSTGFSFESETRRLDTVLRTLDLTPGPNDFDASVVGREQTFAAYGTYQFPWGDWLLLPGLRVENYRREVSSPDVESELNDLHFFPTLHVQRELKDLQIDLSYTSRIERPGISELNPTVRQVDATHASSGNPNLRPSSIDAYEANFTYEGKERSYSLTLYDRLSEDVSSSFVTQVGDVILSTSVNGGDRERRGAQAITRGPIGLGLSSRWRYSLTLNGAETRFDALRDGVLVRDEAFEYDGAASVEYRDQDQNAIGADNVEFEVRFQGPRHTLQQEVDAYVYANVSWRRKLSDRFYGFVQVGDIFASNESAIVTRADDFIERGETFSAGARVRLSLIYQFGGAEARPPSAPNESGQ